MDRAVSSKLDLALSAAVVMVERFFANLSTVFMYIEQVRTVGLINYMYIPGKNRFFFRHFPGKNRFFSSFSREKSFFFVFFPGKIDFFS